jgi:hypothetical protein
MSSQLFLKVGHCDAFARSFFNSAYFMAVPLRDAITLGFSEPEQLTQRKSKRLIEGFVCNPLLFWLIHGTENTCW